jgi:hypothetical protein
MERASASRFQHGARCGGRPLGFTLSPRWPVEDAAAAPTSVASVGIKGRDSRKAAVVRRKCMKTDRDNNG